MATRQGIVSRLACGLIASYQRWLSPLLAARGSRCRFLPSCSAYAYDAFSHLTVFSALRVTVWRLLRCGPWSPGGHDPLIRHSPSPRCGDLSASGRSLPR